MKCHTQKTRVEERVRETLPLGPRPAALIRPFLWPRRPGAEHREPWNNCFVYRALAKTMILKFPFM